MKKKAPHVETQERKCLKKYNPIAQCFILILLSLFFSSLFPAAPCMATEESCTYLLSTRCESCHYLTRVCQKLEKNQKKGFFGNVFSGSWARSINNMVKQGAKLTESEQKKLTECLDNSVPEVLELCNLKK